MRRYQALPRLTVLKATESWAGPGNKAKLHLLPGVTSILFALSGMVTALDKSPPTVTSILGGSTITAYESVVSHPAEAREGHERI